MTATTTMRAAALSGCAALLAALPAAADVPARMPVQGFLTDAAGAPLEGSFDVRFALWDTAVGGTNPIYVEHQTIDVEAGLFSAEIGAETTLDLDVIDGALHLGVALVDDVEMQPRIALGTSPYAARAHRADTAAFADTAGDADTVGGLDPSSFRSADADISFTELSEVPAGLVQLGGLSCVDGQAPVRAGGAWTCGARVAPNQACTPGSVVTGFDVNGAPVCATDRVLSEAEVDAHVADNGYATNIACGTGQVMRGVDATGAAICVDDEDTNTTYSGANFATSNQSCGTNQFMTGISSTGAVQCATISSAAIATAAEAYISANCRLYVGIRDGCNNCTSAPTNWGSTSEDACDPGAGGDNTCQLVTLGGVSVRTVGLALVGDTDDNDKLYIGIECD